MDKKRKIVSDFIAKQKLAVIATTNSEGNPEAGVVEFSLDGELTIIFDTFTSFRKFRNIQNNSRVALVIGWDEDITVQYEGRARATKNSEFEACKRIHFQKFPSAKKFANEKGFVFLKVEPLWICYSNLQKNPWEIFKIEC